APDKVAIRTNERDVRWFDTFLIDLGTGERTPVWENTQQFGRIGLDQQLTPRYAESDLPGGGRRYWLIDGGQATQWFDADFESRLYTGMVCFDASGRHLYMLSSQHHDRAALSRIARSTGEERVLFTSDCADPSDLISDARTFEPIAVCIDAGRREWHALSPEIQTDLALIKAQLPDHDFTVQSQSDDGRRWIVMSYRAQQPGTYHLLDRDRATLTELFTARPELKPYRLAPMHAIEA